MHAGIRPQRTRQGSQAPERKPARRGHRLRDGPGGLAIEIHAAKRRVNRDHAGERVRRQELHEGACLRLRGRFAPVARRRREVRRGEVAVKVDPSGVPAGSGRKTVGIRPRHENQKPSARRRGVGTDSLTALVLAGSLALGTVLASDVFASQASVDRLLFGSLLTIDAGDLTLAAGAALIALAASAAAGHRWLATGFAGDDGSRRGARATDTVLIVLIAMAVTFLTVFVVLPLVVVFAHAYSKGVFAYFSALSDPEALSAIKLTLMVAAISVG